MTMTMTNDTRCHTKTLTMAMTMTNDTQFTENHTSAETALPNRVTLAANVTIEYNCLDLLSLILILRRII